MVGMLVQADELMCDAAIGDTGSEADRNAKEVEARREGDRCLACRRRPISMQSHRGRLRKRGRHTSLIAVTFVLILTRKCFDPLGHES